MALALLAALACSASATASPGWVAPVTVAGGTVTSGPLVTVDPAGGAYVAWAQASGTSEALIYLTSRSPAGQFSAPTPLSSAGESSCPVLAADANGDVFIAWLRTLTSGSIVEATVRSPGGQIRGPYTLSSQTGKAGCPELTLGAVGEATAAWIEGTGASAVVERATASVAGGFGAGGAVSPSGVTAVALSGGSSGDVTIAWGKSGGNVEFERWHGVAALEPPQVFGSEFTTQLTVATDGYGNPTIAWVGTAGIEVGSINASPHTIPGTEEFPLYLKAAVNAQGTALLTWTTFAYAGPEADDFVANADIRPSLLSGWESPVAIAKSTLPMGYTGLLQQIVNGPDINGVVGTGGEATVAWISGAQAAMAAVAPAGQSFQGPIMLSEPQEAVTGNVGLETSETDGLIALWQASPVFETCGCTVEAAIRPSGGSFGPVARLSGPDSAFGSTFSGFGPFAFDAAGDGAAAWIEGTSVRVAGLEATPPTVDALTIPSSGTAGTPVSFAIKGHSNWSNLSASWSWGDGASAGSGTTATHTYSAAGTYTVTAQLIDEAGNVTARSATISIAPASKPPPPPKIVPSFKTSVHAVVVSRKSREVRVSSIVILGTRHGETMRVSCQDCRGMLHSTLHAGAHDQTVISPRGLRIRSRAKILIRVTQTGYVGRRKDYGLTVTRSTPVRLKTAISYEGCLNSATIASVACPKS